MQSICRGPVTRINRGTTRERNLTLGGGRELYDSWTALAAVCVDFGWTPHVLAGSPALVECIRMGTLDQEQVAAFVPLQRGPQAAFTAPEAWREPL